MPSQAKLEESILVTTYLDPDIDGFACVIAYAEFLNKNGKAAIPRVFGQPHKEVVFVARRFDLDFPKAISTEKFKQIILVDMSNTYDLPPTVDPINVVEIIDHRQATELGSFKQAKSQIEKVGSCATLVFEKFHTAGLAPSQSSAILMSAAIISNTLNFLSPLTTDRDRAAARELGTIARLPENFAREMFEAKSDLGGKKLGEAIKGDYLYFNAGQKKMGISQIEMVGTEALVKSRGREILEALDELLKKEELDYLFLSLLDLEASRNLFVTASQPTQELLEKAVAVKFEGPIGRRDGFIMRKQMVPLLQKIMEENL